MVRNGKCQERERERERSGTGTDRNVTGTFEYGTERKGTERCGNERITVKKCCREKYLKKISRITHKNQYIFDLYDLSYQIYK